MKSYEILWISTRRASYLRLLIAIGLLEITNPEHLNALTIDEVCTFIRVLAATLWSIWLLTYTALPQGYPLHFIRSQ
jgi:hypothetical protein